MTDNEKLIEGLPKVALISDERFPFHGTNTQQVIKNVSALSQEGLPIELLIPVQSRGLFRKNYDINREISDYYNIPPGLKIRTLPSIPAGRSRLEKFTHAVIAPLYAYIKGFNIVYTRNEYTTLVASLLGQRVIFETYRLLGDEYPRAMKIAARLTRRKNFLGMILHSKLSSDSMAKAGVPKSKLFPCHNGFDPADIEPRLTKEEARKKLNLPPDQKIILYAGNMQKNKSIESVLDIAVLTPEASFILVGGRDEDIQRLSEYGKSAGIKNISFPGHKPITEVSTYLYAADILLIPTVSDPLKNYGRTVLPFKTFLYIATGRPIIAPNLPDIREVLEDKINALIVEPDNPATTSSAIKELLNSPQQMEQLSEMALKTANNLSWQNRAKNIIRWIKEIDGK